MSELVTVITQQTPLAVNIQNTEMVSYLQPQQKIINLSGGPVAASGASVGSDYLNFNQPTASAAWTINHNFGKKPNVSVYTVGGLEVWAEILHLSDNALQIAFDQPMAGFAILS